MSTLILVRHGPSAYVPPRRTFDHAAVQQWRADYDAAGIVPNAAPPVPLLGAVRDVECIITSDMRRARESAERLSSGQLLVQSALLRETPLPIPRWPTRLPLGIWGALIYLSWKAGASLDRDELRRVEEAAVYCCNGLERGVSRAVVTHGVFRALLAEQLQRDRWRLVARRGGYGHWSAWVLERPFGA